MASTDESLLRASWRRAVGSGAAADTALAQVLARYREPHRHYHGLAHLTAALRHVERLLREVPGVHDPDAVRAAAFFHDAIYDPRSTTNEHDSAALARSTLGELGWPFARAEAVAELVLATEPSGGQPGPDAGVDRDILLDADLAVLGAEPAVYGAYVRGVRAEYGHVGDEAWRAGRSRVLRSLLDRDPIYATAPFRAERELRARANMAAELATLDRRS